jgi:hypothetical protein
VWGVECETASKKPARLQPPAVVGTGTSLSSELGPHGTKTSLSCREEREREFFIHNLLDRIHLIMSQMFLVDRPRAMGV